MRTKYKHSFNRLIFTNRWKQTGKMRYWGDFTLIGISKYWFSTTAYEWRLHFIGLELRFWMELKPKK